MKRINKTEKNLRTIYENLDKAYECMERVLEDLYLMQTLPDELKTDMERFDISKISCLKGDVEELIEEIKTNKGE